MKKHILLLCTAAAITASAAPSLKAPPALSPVPRSNAMWHPQDPRGYGALSWLLLDFAPYTTQRFGITPTTAMVTNLIEQAVSPVIHVTSTNAVEGALAVAIPAAVQAALPSTITNLIEDAVTPAVASYATNQVYNVATSNVPDVIAALLPETVTTIAGAAAETALAAAIPAGTGFLIVDQTNLVYVAGGHTNHVTYIEPPAGD